MFKVTVSFGNLTLSCFIRFCWLSLTNTIESIGDGDGDDDEDDGSDDFIFDASSLKLKRLLPSEAHEKVE